MTIFRSSLNFRIRSRVRPWYRPVVNDKQPSWSPIYANADERQEITLSALAPIYDDNEFKSSYR
ncbi:hypothetical protein OK016_09795 [Vibrio chagasii]|nr:hypothetical protein [Vibrio chagasii]